MNARQFVLRRPLQLPEWTSLSADLQLAFLQADRSLRRARVAAAAASDWGLNGSLAPPRLPQRHIHHPLSVKFPRVTEDIGLDASRRELSVLRSLAGSSPFSGGLSVVEGLTQVAGRFTGRYTVRTGSIVTNQDPLGRRVCFPPAAVIPEQMAKLATLMATAQSVPNSFRAIVALVLITNCHPFPDGNGRTARLVFNALASPGADHAEFYLPLKELARYSRGGFIIRKRMAEIHGEWKPLADFVAASADLWRDRLNHRSTPARTLGLSAVIDRRHRLPRGEGMAR